MNKAVKQLRILIRKHQDNPPEVIHALDDKSWSTASSMDIWTPEQRVEFMLPTETFRSEAIVSPEFERAFIAAYHVRCKYCQRLQLINDNGECIGCGAPL